VTEQESKPPSARAWAAPFAVLFLLAAAHTVFLFGWPPRLPREAGDWPKEIRYYSVLQQAVRDGVVPYFVSRPIQETRKLLAIPEVVLSPQIVLLRWLSVDAFVFVNVLLLQAVALLGALALRRRYALSLPTVTLLWLVLAFNGHVTAHFAIGHSMWGGYFLLPFFFLLAFDLVDRGPSPRWPVHVGLVLGAMLLQGSYHVFVWCVLLLLMLLVTQPARRAVVLALAWSAGLGLVRIVPAAVILLGRREQAFETGYATAGDLLAGLVAIRDVTYPRRGSGAMGGLNWWEFDAYVGVAALAWLLVAGLAGMASRERARRLGGPALVMALLSLDGLYGPIHALGLPLLASQRVSSRFLIVPIGLLAVAAATATEAWLRRGQHGRRVVVWMAALATAGLLSAHSRAWTMAEVGARLPPPPRERDLEIEIAPAGDTPRDALYVRSVQLSAAGSAAALALALATLRRRTVS